MEGNKTLSENIAYYLDAYSGIIVFGMDYKNYNLFNAIMKDVYSKVKVKTNFGEIIDQVHMDSLKETAKDGVFFVDLDKLTGFNKDVNKFVNDLRQFCVENNNTVVINKSVFSSLSIGTNAISTLTPNTLLYSASVILMINNGKITCAKNRYDSFDIINHSLLAYIRDIKIDEILND